MGRYRRFADRVLATSIKPFGTARARTAALELILVLMLLLALPASAMATAITEFALPSGVTPGPPTAGPDGNVWFPVGGAGSGVDRISPNGTITNFPTAAGSRIHDIALGADGNLWAGDIGLHAIWKITPTGAATEYTGVAATPIDPEDLTLGPDGNIWFLDGGNHAVGDITPAGAITEYATGTGTGTLTALAAGAGQTLWFTAEDPSAIGEVNLAGPVPQVSDFPLSSTALPNDITLGAGSDMWFTDDGTPSQIGRVSPQGVITEFGTANGLSANADPGAITLGPNGNVWFDDQDANARAVGQVTPAGQITEYHAGLTDGVPEDLTFGIDGNLWVPQAMSADAPATVDRITAAGAVASFTSGVNADGGGSGETIISGPDGNLWFNDVAGNGGSPPAIGKISLQLPPTAITNPATAIGNTGATVDATVDPLGSDTDVSFQYGTMPAMTQTLDAGTIPASGSASDVTATLANLPPGALIYYRAVATSASGSATGATETFTTTAEVFLSGGMPRPMPIAPTTTAPTSASPTTKPPVAPVEATMRLGVGNQRLTLLTPEPAKPYACFATTAPFTATLSDSTAKTGRRLTFVGARLTLGGTSPHTLRRLPGSASFSLKKLKPGIYALKIALAFDQSRRSKHAEHHRAKSALNRHDWVTGLRVC